MLRGATNSHPPAPPVSTKPPVVTASAIRAQELAEQAHNQLSDIVNVLDRLSSPPPDPSEKSGDPESVAPTLEGRLQMLNRTLLALNVRLEQVYRRLNSAL